MLNSSDSFRQGFRVVGLDNPVPGDLSKKIIYDNSCYDVDIHLDKRAIIRIFGFLRILRYSKIAVLIYGK